MQFIITNTTEDFFSKTSMEPMSHAVIGPNAHGDGFQVAFHTANGLNFAFFGDDGNMTHCGDDEASEWVVAHIDTLGDNEWLQLCRSLMK
jgi:hypothetical protein